MSELGERFRQAREAQGLSLAQAAVETRILQPSLIALEEGAYQRLPGDVVTRGFIRNYANYLGLSTEEMIELYRRERGATDQIRIIRATNPPRIRSYVVPSFFGVFFVTIALVALSYVALSAVGRIGERSTSASVAATATVRPPTPLPTVPTAAEASGVAVVPTITLPSLDPALTPQPSTIAGGVAPELEASPTPAAPIVLEVFIPSARGNENSWLRVQTDGSIVFEGFMRAGERQTFLAQRRVEIRAGNPPDVQVTVNGLQQGPLGQVPGQPVNWPWPPQ
jgi:cytoskeletal protein RodZ